MSALPHAIANAEPDARSETSVHAKRREGNTPEGNTPHHTRRDHKGSTSVVTSSSCRSVSDATRRARRHDDACAIEDKR